MQWPEEVIEAFRQVPFRPKKGETKETVVQYLLDQSARFAVWRVKGNPANLPSAYNFPYTLLGYLSGTGFGGKVEHCIFDDRWFTAVDKLYAHVRKHIEEIMSHFQVEAQPYPEDLGGVSEEPRG